MANVRVKYLGNIRRITGKESEEISAESLGELIEEIGRRYRDKEMHYYLSEMRSTDPSLVVTHNGRSVRDIRDYERRLEDGDEVMLMTVISGG